MRNSVILLILLLISNGSCVPAPFSPAQQDQKSVELIKQVNDILDKMETPEFWEQKVSESNSPRFALSPRIIYMPELVLGEELKAYKPSVQVDVNFLVENKYIALPLIFKRLDRAGVNVSDWTGKKYDDFCTPKTECGLKTRQLLVFFCIFWKAKSIESMPYLWEFLRSIPREIDNKEENVFVTITCAKEAISAITERKVKIYRPLGKIKENEKRAAIATLAQEWYDEYKKNQNKDK